MCLYCTLSDSRLCNSLYPPCWLVGGSSPLDLVFYWHNIACIIREWWIPFFEIRKWRLGMSWEFGELHSSLRLEPGVVMWGKISERERMAQYSQTPHLSQFCYKTDGKFVHSRRNPMEKSWQDKRKQTHHWARAPLLQACWFILSYGVEFTELNVDTHIGTCHLRPLYRQCRQVNVSHLQLKSAFTLGQIS